MRSMRAADAESGGILTEKGRDTRAYRLRHNRHGLSQSAATASASDGGQAWDFG
jgi:hypothetical protein